MRKEPTVNALISPEGSLEILSNHEVNRLKDRSEGGLYRLFRQCALAVLNTGAETDDCKDLMEEYSDFDVRLVPQPRGLKLEVVNAPASAFVDGDMLRAIREHLFSVLRDIVYSNTIPTSVAGFRRDNPEDITNLIFHVLRNARATTGWRARGVIHGDITMITARRDPAERRPERWAAHTTGRFRLIGLDAGHFDLLSDRMMPDLVRALVPAPEPVPA